MSERPDSYTLAWDEDILARLARLIHENHARELPDLRAVRVLLPNTDLADTLRIELLNVLPDAACIPPWIGTIDRLCQTHAEDRRTIDESQRKLLFIETLGSSSVEFRRENKWQLTTALLDIFDDLYLADTDILTMSAEDWTDHLQSLYDTNSRIDSLSSEADLIRTLWAAWQDQLDAMGLIDPVRALIDSVRSYRSEAKHYFIRSDANSFLERRLIDHLVSRIDIEVIDVRSDYSATSRGAMIQNAFDLDRTIPERQASALSMGDHLLRLFPSPDEETEARAVEFEVRRSWLSGHRNIGIVCEDRKLARRIRALLERAHIMLDDTSGWTLATTSAATIIETWLECIEEDFNHALLIDLLKSNFYLDKDESTLLPVYRFEQDIITMGNVASNLSLYIRRLEERERGLRHWDTSAYQQMIARLEEIEAASQPLMQLYLTGTSVPLSNYIETLMTSLRQLGIEQRLSDDEAGRQVLECIDSMRSALTTCDPSLGWNDFRTWLGTELENRYFNPDQNCHGVRLLNLEQSYLHRFDRLIIAAMDKRHIPGSNKGSPFFNEHVRHELGMPDWRSRYAVKLHKFEHLLAANSDVLITYLAEEDGEPIPRSPWLDTLINTLGQGDMSRLRDDELVSSLSVATPIVHESTPRPVVQSGARTSIPEHMIPKELSASSYQRLMDCPYQFFASDALRLRPTDEVTLELQKSEYGQIIHRILELFHRPDSDHRFPEVITRENSVDAIEHLVTLTEQQFTPHIEQNILHRSWLTRWSRKIPMYIHWMAQHQKHARILSTEQKHSIEIAHGRRLSGRIDRKDRTDDDNTLIIDYKTGRSKKQEALLDGEDVQLTCYAMMDADTTSAMNLYLDDDKIRSIGLSEDELEPLRASNLERLNGILGQILAEEPLPANGDDVSCGYCDFAGICRRDMWE